MSEPTLFLECDHHGNCYATFVCRHLASGQGRGFFTANVDDDPKPDAWCFACEQVLKAVGTWNDESESFAGISLLCSGCYDDARQRNSEIRPSLETDGWCLGTRADVFSVTPDQEFPAQEKLAELAEGD